VVLFSDSILLGSSLFAYYWAAVVHARALRTAFTRVLAARIVGVTDPSSSHARDTLKERYMNAQIRKCKKGKMHALRAKLATQLHEKVNLSLALGILPFEF
jgi:hypothetical protein